MNSSDCITLISERVVRRQVLSITCCGVMHENEVVGLRSDELADSRFVLTPHSAASLAKPKIRLSLLFFN